MGSSQNAIPSSSFYTRHEFTPPARTAKNHARLLSAARSDPQREFRSFPQQQSALDYIASRPQNRLELWSFEVDGKGCRRYVTASYEAFWRFYSQQIRRDAQVHYYEVIRESAPCKLYFDLEYNQGVNGNVQGDVLVDELIAACGEKSGISLTRRDAVELDSTSPKKFSRHLIFEDIAFHDNIQAGEFVRCVVEELAGRDRALVMVRKEDGSETPFVDLGVYTKNRCFRLVGSSKFGKRRRLMPYGQSEGRVSMSKEYFMKSLAGNVGKGVTLRGEPCVLRSMTSRGMPGDGDRKRFAGLRRSGGGSGHRYLDEYVHSIIEKEGGGINSVIETEGSDSFVFAIKGGYKFCANVGRHHKSNNVMLIADLKSRCMYQKCFDPDCRGFRSQAWPIPQWAFSMCQDVEDEELALMMDNWEGGVQNEVEDAALNEMMDRIESSPSVEA